MTLEEFEQATERQLRSHANDCLSRAEYPEARFYMDEIARRHEAKIVRRDLVLELIIVALIAGEIAFGAWEGRKQAEILQHIQTSIPQLPPVMVIPGSRSRR